MKQKIFAVSLGILLAAFAYPVFAAPSVVVDNLDGTDGPALSATATTASVTVTFASVPGNTGGANFDIEFNKTALSTVLTSICPGGWVCTQVSSGVRFVSPPDFGGNLAGWTREVIFNLTAATAGTTYPLTVTNQVYADVNFANLPASGTADGSIQILPPTPDANFSPNAGALNLGSAPQNTITSTIVNIDNVGPTGSLLDASCIITANNLVFSLVNNVVNGLTAAATPHPVTVNCISPVVQVHNGQMTCTHNGDGTTDASPVVYSLACEMTTGPTPDYTSVPAPGSALAFGNPVKDTADPTLNVSITNTGDAGTTLNSAGCSFTNNPNSAYSFTGGSGAFGLATTDPARVVIVSCDTAVVGNHSGGVLSCPHNGSNTATPATYTLNCQVDPVPKGDATLTAISPVSIPQNNTPLPAGNVTLKNIGDPGSNLSGSCSLANIVGTAIQFAPGSAGAYSLAQNASKIVGVQCNSAAQPGVHSADVSCTENDPNFEGPANFPFSCTVGQPDPAVYASTPEPGATIDITGGSPVPEGKQPDPTAGLQIRNEAAAGDANMLLTCNLQDDVGTAITSSPALSSFNVAPGGSVGVTFTCDTAAASLTPYKATYNCDYLSQFVTPLPVVEENLESGQSFSGGSYTVSCEVREGASEVEPSPADGTTLSGAIPPGGSKSFFIDFDEVAGEGVAGKLLSCELASGADFKIISPVAFPVDVPAAGTVTVEVKGTDPGGADSISDTLTCMYADSDSDDVKVSYPLLLTIGGDARFTVLKDFTDGNPGEVTVDLDCDTGLILDQKKIISEDGIGVTFVVTDFDAGKLNCNVTERPVAGYSADYSATGDSASTDSSDSKKGCFYTLVAGGDENSCVITNSPDAVELVITKEWLYPGSADASAVSDYFELEIHCINVEIDKGYDCGNFVTENTSAQVNYYSCRRLKGNGDEVFTVDVVPFIYPGGSCYVAETYADQAVEVDNGCAGKGQGLFVLDISAGSGDSCTITNTVFFEGIPTLNQYGMALMALLMLGMGFVAVRRLI